MDYKKLDQEEINIKHHEKRKPKNQTLSQIENSGNLQLRNIFLKYKTSDDFVLKNINLNVKSGEKVRRIQFIRS